VGFLLLTFEIRQKFKHENAFYHHGGLDMPECKVELF